MKATAVRPPQSRYVIAANYKDRQSSYKWLVRRADEGTRDAVPCREIIAKNVTFGEATQEEYHHGCAYTAEVGTDVSGDMEIKGVAPGYELTKLAPFKAPVVDAVEVSASAETEPSRLKFTPHGFSMIVRKCSELHLREDGSMYAIA